MIATRAKSTAPSVIISAVLAIPLLTGAADKDTTEGPGQLTARYVARVDATAPISQKMPVYIPPLRGAPATRVGGASRGTAEESIILRVLAPDHTGLTIRTQPSLYWYLSKPVTSRLEFTLIDGEAIRPLAEIRLEAPDSPGTQRIELSEYGVNLESGVEYQWFVALVPDSGQRSNDILAGGTIKRIQPPSALTDKIERASGQQLTYVFAAEGLWYDAIAVVSDLISASPNDGALHAQRAALLEQVGLEDVAARDRTAAFR